MLKISVREFRSHLKEYLNRLREEPLQVGGLAIQACTQERVHISPVYTVEEAKACTQSNKRVHTQKDLYNDDGELMCKKCKQYRAMNSGLCMKCERS
jgi:hypothetical protein